MPLSIAEVKTLATQMTQKAFCKRLGEAELPSDLSLAKPPHRAFSMARAASGGFSKPDGVRRGRA